MIIYAVYNQYYSIDSDNSMQNITDIFFDKNEAANYCHNKNVQLGKQGWFDYEAIDCNVHNFSKIKN